MMIKSVLAAAFVTFGAGLAAVPVTAATIGFDGVTAGSYTNPGPNNQILEDGFYFRLDGIDAVAGVSGIELQRTPGATAVLGSRTSFWGPTINGGFEFTSLDWRSTVAGAAAQILVTGREFQSGNWFTDVFSTGSDSFQTFAATNLIGQTVDQLWISIDDGNTGAGALDNLVLTPINVHPAPVPLPAAGATLLTALAGLGLWRRREKVAA